MPSLRKIAIYSRKSKFTGKGESIYNQIEMCQQYIAAHFAQASPENILIFEDEGFSGKNTNRPQFQAMMRMVQNPAAFGRCLLPFGPNQPQHWGFCQVN